VTVLMSAVACTDYSTLLITCRIKLHCFAWSFVSHVGIRSCLVLYQAVIVLR